jgi:hypothetical protein
MWRRNELETELQVADFLLNHNHPGEEPVFILLVEVYKL